MKHEALVYEEGNTQHEPHRSQDDLSKLKTIVGSSFSSLLCWFGLNFPHFLAPLFTSFSLAIFIFSGFLSLSLPLSSSLHSSIPFSHPFYFALFFIRPAQRNASMRRIPNISHFVPFIQSIPFWSFHSSICAVHLRAPVGRFYELLSAVHFPLCVFPWLFFVHQ